MTLDNLIARAALPRLLRALEGLEHGRLALELPDGSVHAFGRDGGLPPSRVRIGSPAFFRRLLLSADIGFGESYMAGEWQADDLPAFLALVARNEERLAVAGGLSRLLNLGNDLLHRLRRNTRRGSRRNISFHYDLSNEFFGLFLDETMTYSSALFEHAQQPLGEAQLNKYRSLAHKAQLGPGDHVLEIGCGWGSFAVYAARSHGCRVTGITVSQRQYEAARARVSAAGLEGQVEHRRQDSRDVRGRFDKVVSIEMFEALGREHWPLYFGQIERLLAPEGIAVIQTISIPDRAFEAYARHCDWIQKHVFPGGLLASVHHVTGAMIRSSRLNLHQLEDIGVHYALTLERWREQFLRRLPEVRALGFDERFIRTWDFYLAACQAYFATRRLGDLQLVLTRPGNVALAGIPAAGAAREEAA